MTTKTIEHVQNQLEELVREHLADTAKRGDRRRRARIRVGLGAVNTRAPGRAMSRRRPPTEVAGLAEQLYAAVRASSGEQMIIGAR